MWLIRELAPFTELEGRSRAKSEKTRDADLSGLWMQAAVDHLETL